MSVEAEARKKTEDMTQVLSLTADQKNDVMVANMVYLKLVKNLTDNNETSKMGAAKQSYLNKLKSILTTEQYSKFESEMGG
jgi:nanoRNase/pAp phosphatase (c-di-AMP/oligoRNAs hydrolase)